MLVYTPVSWGELLDKITILQIKSERMSDPQKLVNVRKELDELNTTVGKTAQLTPVTVSLMKDLKVINEKLWVIEDDIRECERQKDFGAKFIELARGVYFTNDERARLKREINADMGSTLVEEKSYAAY
jgi:cob(I)alamin adenosyltransferase